MGYYGVYDYCVNVKDCDAEKEILKNGVADLVKNYAKSSSGVTVDGNYVWEAIWLLLTTECFFSWRQRF